MKIIAKRRNFLFVAFLLFFAALLFAGCMGCGGNVTIRYFSGDEEVFSTVGPAGSPIVPPPAPTREGYLFTGWTLRADGTGEGEEAPVVMPARDTDYYAKFARASRLTLDAGAWGELGQGELLAPVGGRMLDAVQVVAPKVTKENLSFGGWYLDQRALTASDLVTEEGATLTARYLASYEVKVYREGVNGGYALCEEEGRTGRDFLGVKIPVVAAAGTGFTLDEERTKPLFLTADGDNVYSVYFRRNLCNLTYAPNPPSGTTYSGSMGVWSFRYGSEVPLEENEYEISGYRFAGWKSTHSGTVYAPNDVITLTEHATFSAVWEQCMRNAFGGSDLISLPHDRDNAVYLIREGLEEKAGRYEKSTGRFVFEENGTRKLQGKINEPAGVFSYEHAGMAGTYTLFDGVNLAPATTLVLDTTCLATCTVGGTAHAGAYYLDGESGFYTFRADDGTLLFFFSVQAEGSTGENVFLICGSGRREGYRRAVYAGGTVIFKEGYDLTFDGYGNIKIGEETYEYFPVGRTERYAEYLLKNEKEELYIATLFAAYGGEWCYLVRDASLYGSFSGEGGTLTLDGYGFSATATGKGETKTETYEAHFSPSLGGYLIKCESAAYLVYPAEGSFTPTTDFEEYRLFSGGAVHSDRTFLLYEDGRAEIYAFSEGSGRAALASLGTYEARGEEYFFEGEPQAGFEGYPAEMRFVFYREPATGERVYCIFSERIGEERKEYVTEKRIAGGVTLTITRGEATQENPLLAWYSAYGERREGLYYTAREPRFQTEYLLFVYSERGRAVELAFRKEGDALSPLASNPAREYRYRGNGNYGVLYTDGRRQAEVTVAGQTVRGTYGFVSGGTETDWNAMRYRFTGEGVSFLFQLSGEEFCVYDGAYVGQYAGNGCAVTLDGYSLSAIYRDARNMLFPGEYLFLEENVIAFSSAEFEKSLLFRLNNDGRTMEELDGFYGSYESETGERIFLNGAGEVSREGSETGGVYEILDPETGVLWVAFGEEEGDYRFFPQSGRYLKMDGFEGAYANGDWETILFDGFGGVRYFDPEGVLHTGEYVPGEDGLFLLMWEGTRAEVIVTEHSFEWKTKP